MPLCSQQAPPQPSPLTKDSRCSLLSPRLSLSLPLPSTGSQAAPPSAGPPVCTHTLLSFCSCPTQVGAPVDTRTSTDCPDALSACSQGRTRSSARPPWMLHAPGCPRALPMRAPCRRWEGQLLTCQSNPARSSPAAGDWGAQPDQHPSWCCGMLPGRLPANPGLWGESACRPSFQQLT